MKVKMFRILCMIMVVVILFSVTVQPPAKAIALVDDLLVLGGLLIAMGYTFYTVGDFQKATKGLLNELTQTLGNSFNAMMDGIVWCGETGFNMGVSAVQNLAGVIDGIMSKQQGDAFVVPDGDSVVFCDNEGRAILSYDATYTSETLSGAQLVGIAKTECAYDISCEKKLEFLAGDYIYSSYMEIRGSSYLSYYYMTERKNIKTGQSAIVGIDTGLNENLTCYLIYLNRKTTSGVEYLYPQLVYYRANGILGGLASQIKITDCSITGNDLIKSIPVADLGTRPAEISISVGQTDVYTPDEVIGTLAGGGTISVPDVRADLANPDITVPLTAAQATVLNPAIPLDPPITGEPWDNVANGWPALTTLFPFCIPFDIAAMIKAFAATPEAPVFRVSFPAKIFPGGGVVEMDMNQFDTIAVIVRVIVLISFIFGLMVLTGKVIRW